jgi:hypothetical protein
VTITNTFDFTHPFQQQCNKEWTDKPSNLKIMPAKDKSKMILTDHLKYIKSKVQTYVCFNSKSGIKITVKPAFSKQFELNKIAVKKEITPEEVAKKHQ